MRGVLSGCVVAIAALVLVLPSIAQTAGPPSAPTIPNEPTPNTPPGGAPATTPSIVGTWSGQGTGPGGTVQQAEEFGADGKYMGVGRLANGSLVRIWGTWHTTPAGPDQLRLEVQVQGWLPKELCREQDVGPPRCQPTQHPAGNTSLVTFLSPDRLRSASGTTPGVTVQEARDSQPALLQAAVPERWVYAVNPLATGPAGCDDVQQRRVCSVLDGHMTRRPNGCLACTTD